MKEILLTRGMVAVVDDEDYGWLSEMAWHAVPSADPHRWYAKHSLSNGRGIYMHQLLLPCEPPLEPDHIDRNGLNNQRFNLRRGTRSQNMANRPTRASSGFRGVYLARATGLFQAQIRVNNRIKSLGYFDNPSDGAVAYDRAALDAFGEFATLNFPESGRRGG